MNRIIVENNIIIPYNSNGILINDNTITFINNGNYCFDYIDCDNIYFNVNINDNLCISLLEYSNCNEININNSYNLNKNSSLILCKFYANEGTEENINIYLNGEKSSIKYNFSSMVLDSV